MRVVRFRIWRGWKQKCLESREVRRFAWVIPCKSSVPAIQADGVGRGLLDLLAACNVIGDADLEEGGGKAIR